MRKNIFIFILIVINQLNCSGLAKKNNTIINGHDNMDKIDELLYVGMPLKSAIQLLGSPLKLNCIKNKIFYLFSKRKINLIPINGKHIDGSILIITLDENDKIKEIKKQSFKEFKNIEKIKNRKKEVEIEKQEIEKKMKKINEKNKKEAYLKIQKIDKDKKKVKIKKKN